VHWSVLLLVESCTSFVKFIPRYLIFFEAIVNGIVFLYSFSVCSLLVYRKATDFYVDFVFCYIAEAIYGVWEFLGGVFFASLKYRIMLSANRDSLSIFYLFVFLLLFLPALLLRLGIQDCVE
jgi:hypothetical protein